MKYQVKRGRAFLVSQPGASEMMEIVGGDIVPEHVAGAELAGIMHGLIPIDEPAPKPVPEPEPESAPEPKRRKKSKPDATE